MGNAKFRDVFKRDAVHPLPDSGLLANHEKKITVRDGISVVRTVARQGMRSMPERGVIQGYNRQQS